MHELSDIDLAVEGLPDEEMARAHAEVLDLAPCPVDLIHLEEVTAPAAARIRSRGRLRVLGQGAARQPGDRGVLAGACASINHARPRAFTELEAAMNNVELKVPEQMKAAVIDRFGRPEEVMRVTTVPVPEVGGDEVLIRVAAAGVGPWDPELCEGQFGRDGDHFPRVLGSDGAGTVVVVGPQARRVKVGDRVYAWGFLNPKGGLFAEYAALPEEEVSLIQLTAAPVGSRVSGREQQDRHAQPMHRAGGHLGPLIPWEMEMVSLKHYPPGRPAVARHLARIPRAGV